MADRRVQVRLDADLAEAMQAAADAAGMSLSAWVNHRLRQLGAPVPVHPTVPQRSTVSAAPSVVPRRPLRLR